MVLFCHLGNDDKMYVLYIMKYFGDGDYGAMKIEDEIGLKDYFLYHHKPKHLSKERRTEIREMIQENGLSVKISRHTFSSQDDLDSAIQVFQVVNDMQDYDDSKHTSATYFEYKSKKK